MQPDAASRGFSISATTFDEYSADYDAALARGLSVSGEGKSYFARGRIEWLARCVLELGAASARVLDFGCGVGTASQLFADVLGARSLVGVDVSERSLAIAKRDFRSGAACVAQFSLLDDYVPSGEVDLAFCNGVFHHVSRVERARAVDYVHRSLAPGGLFSFWENNPWNPGARYVMSRIPFDRDAVMLSVREASSLLVGAGFELVRRDFLFVFPRALRPLRALERRLSRLPLGAQYQVLARKRA